MTATSTPSGQAAKAAEGAADRASRDVYRDVLMDLMRADDRVVCLDSDTGLFSSVDWGAAAERYINVGIAEQNLMGVAAGMAKMGRIAFVTTMATFAATRALEAVKIDIALNNLPVRLAATHGGLSAGHLGPTHHALEDLAVMRLLPNMTVLSPADAASTAELTRACAHLPGPVYLRLGRDATPELGSGLPPVRIGRARRLRSGGDVTLVATGPYPVLAALAAADELSGDGVEATVLDIHTVKPLDQAALVDAARATRGIVTVEEHWAAGGLGSAVAEVLCGLDDRCPVLPVAIQDTFAIGTGGQRHLLERNGLTPEAVVARVRNLLGPGMSRSGRRRSEIT
jgi:transketolase